MGPLAIVGLGAVVVAVIVIAAALWRQGYPESRRTDPEASSDRGPTGEDYPPGSRPAGPGAEEMIEPSTPEET